jgi:hypothetical protein
MQIHAMHAGACTYMHVVAFGPEPEPRRPRMLLPCLQ